MIRSRGREWVVLPESNEDLIIAKPLGGLDEEIAGIIPAIERVESASFSLPSREDVGDFRTGYLLREAGRLSTRASTGPFRSFGRIAVEPRPYQLVPLMMALKLDPIRLLIADDVGIGKTIEAALVAREMIDRAEIRRFTVLCPPHLAEQWQKELFEKFHIEAELILSSTIQRLERDLPIGVSVFDRHRYTIVSMDFIKSTKRVEDFVAKCPELVIVDEAHGCTVAGGVGRGRQQRYDLLKRISSDQSRHLVLVTATPHSGNEEAFRSMLGLLDTEFNNLPSDLERTEREGVRRKLARHLVQRRRADIRHYLETDTAFPDRKDKEVTYTFSPEYKSLFKDILDFARDFVTGSDGGHRQRVRYWSALALLRCVSSSPAAASATLRSRAQVADADDEYVDEIGRQTVLDQSDDDEALVVDLSPGSVTEEGGDNNRRTLLEFARRAEALAASDDRKLEGAAKEIKSLISDGFHPVIFCRFIDTAEYVARKLRESLPARVRIASVTGTLPPSEREARIADLTAQGGDYVLVCTDCLSEGINLQQQFDAVFHYDLAWNPTRHEQREGRVDRFGQVNPEVKVITYYGTDNPIDGVILDVLIRKHKSIKSDLGVTVAVPGSSEQIAEALFEGALFRQSAVSNPQQLSLAFIDELGPTKDDLHREWDNARDREKVSRSRFAQYTLSPDAVAAELADVRLAIGGSDEVQRFFSTALHSANVPFQMNDESVTVHLGNEVARGLRQAIGRDESFTGRFELPLGDGDEYLGRTSPIIEGLASWTLDQALDPSGRDSKPIAARCGITRTKSVDLRTTLLLARFRYHLGVAGAEEGNILCEEIIPLAYKGPADEPVWLPSEEGESLLMATPSSNVMETLREQQMEILVSGLPKVRTSLDKIANERAQNHLASHIRVREATRTKGSISIEPVLPVDILGAYILLPTPE